MFPTPHIGIPEVYLEKLEKTKGWIPTHLDFLKISLGVSDGLEKMIQTRDGSSTSGLEARGKRREKGI